MKNRVKSCKLFANHLPNLELNSQKTKCKKVFQSNAKLKEEVQQLKTDYEKIIHHRTMMQTKLKEIYLKNNKQNLNSYRDVNVSSTFVSSTASSISRGTISTSTNGNRSNISNGSSFFNANAPMMQNLGVKP